MIVDSLLSRRLFPLCRNNICQESNGSPNNTDEMIWERIAGESMRVSYVDESGEVKSGDTLDGVTPGECRVLWVDLEDPQKGELEEITDHLGLHPVTFRSYEQENAVPTVQEYQDYLKINWDFIDKSDSEDDIEIKPIVILLGDCYLVTVHQTHLEEIDKIFDMWVNEPETYHQDSASLLYDVLEMAVEDYYPIAEELSEEIDECIDRLMDSSSRKDLQSIMSIKHKNMAMRRTMIAHRDVMMQLSRRDMPHIPQHLYEYLIHVYDHMIKVGVEVENNGDLISSALDIYLSSVSNKLNITMKRLTTIATIFMPLTFIVGLYGMNFKYMPEFNWHYGYLFAWGTIIVTTIIMVIIAKKFEWF